MRALRIAIAGGPRAGKTTAARAYGTLILHTDDVKGLPWSDASFEVSRWFDRSGSWVIEGVTVMRGLRKWLARNGTGKPCDILIFIEGSRLELNTRQEGLRQQVQAQFDTLSEELRKRGCIVEVKKGIGREEMRNA